MKSKVVLSDLRAVVLSGVFIAFSYLGALVKIQGSVALDALPAFLGVLILGPAYGGLIGLAGHLLTAMLAGFPLTLPVHVLVAVLMMVTVECFGFLYRNVHPVLAVLGGILLNGPVSLAIISGVSSILFMPFSGMLMFSTLAFPLTAASTVNVLGAYILYLRIINKKKTGGIL